MAAAWRIEGLAEATRRLRELPDRISKRVIRKSVNAGAQPMVKTVRSNTPRRTGLTRRSMAVKLKSYRSAAVAVIGQDKRSRPKVRRGAGGGGGGGISGRGYPVPIHLVDAPTRPHTIAGRVLRWLRGSTVFHARAVRHPGTRGQAVMSRSFASARSAAESAMVEKMRGEIDREAQTLGGA